MTETTPAKIKKSDLDAVRGMHPGLAVELLTGGVDTWPDAFRIEAQTLANFRAAKKRGAIPSKGGDDVVYTPDPLAFAIVDHFKPRGMILEPFAGGGAFLRAFDRYNEENRHGDEVPLTVIHSMEIAPPDGSPGSDFFAEGPPLSAYDWIVTNGPWSLTQETIAKGMELQAEIVLLIYVNSFFTNLRGRMMDAAGYYLAEIAKVDGPKVWASMGMQLAAMHFRPKCLCRDPAEAELCRMSRIEYDNPAPPPKPRKPRAKA